MNTPDINEATDPATDGTPLRLLLIEDDPTDARLTLHALRHAGFAVEAKRVETREDYIAAMERDPELIIADYNLPEFNAMEALAILRETGKEIPFIIVSGTIGEETAVEALKLGAADCVNKANLPRLGPVVNRALREAKALRERRRTEGHLRNLSSAVEHSPASIMITDAAGGIEYVNPKFVEVTGYTAAEVIGQNPNILKSGKTSDVTYEEMWRTIRAGDEWHGEFHNRRKNGELFWEHASISGIRDESGTITHFVAVKEDITERKKLEAQLLRAQRMESIGTLASGLAHDLNNILAPIMMSVPVLRMEMSAEARERIIATIEMSAERGAQIIRLVLAFGRGLEGERRPRKVGALIEEIMKIMGETFPKNLKIEGSIGPALWPVIADATQLHQVLLNLCVNARDAMPDGGTLRLSAANLDLDASYASMIHEATTPGPHVLIEVSDTGSGIPPEIIERIFDPFFTTKEVGKGTGLGLSTVHGIVKSHGGFIHVDTQPGKGTTFQVWLPAAPDHEAAPTDASHLTVPEGHGELVLVVDDEEAVRGAAQTVLEIHGYRVLQAADGTEALAVFAQNSASIAIVLTDLMMPLMDGMALIQALRTMQPAMPIIASTGLGGKARMAGLKAMQVEAVLSKPYRADALLRTIHEALHPAATSPAV